jgi:hypothetical protein
MFIQVIQGQATNPDGISAEVDRWKVEVAFHDSTRVHTYKDGGSDQAGFVQVIQGHSPDMERLAELGRAMEQQMAEQAPHILGRTVAEHTGRVTSPRRCPSPPRRTRAGSSRSSRPRPTPASLRCPV